MKIRSTHARGRFVWTFFALIVISLGTLVAILWANGYRPSGLVQGQIVAGNGLLIVNSDPKGARVLVNDRFITATDDKLYLDPGEYTIEMQKDGYFPWKKKIKVEKEVVTQANALLLPTAPSLSPLSLSGAQRPVPSPDGQKLIYFTASSSAQTNNGYYVTELDDNPLAFQRGPRQVTRISTQFPLTETQVLWSPDSSEILLVSPQKAVLLDPGKLNEIDTLTDVTYQLPTLFSQWEQEMYLRDRQRLAKFPLQIEKVATASAVNVYFSPDEKKLMYTATDVFTLPEGILPAKPGSNDQEQQRTTEKGGIYVYDRDEDRQFRIGTDNQYLAWLQSAGEASGTLKPSPTTKTKAATKTTVKLPTATEVIADLKQPYNPQKHLLADDLWRGPLTVQASPSAFTRLQSKNLDETLENFRTYHSPLFSNGYQWFPNSAHIITYDDKSIMIREYDNTNQVTVYSGPFDGKFVYPWPNGSRLIVLTNFNQGQGIPENLYTINLK